jgi:hypothetical protein
VKRPVTESEVEAMVDAIEDELTSDPTQYTYPVYEVSSETPTRPVELSGVFSEVYDGGRSVRMVKEPTVELPIPPDAAAAKGRDRSFALFSDGAASCLVSSEPAGDAVRARPRAVRTAAARRR